MSARDLTTEELKAELERRRNEPSFEVRRTTSNVAGSCNFCKRYINIKGRSIDRHELVEITSRSNGGLTVRFCLLCLKQLKASI